MVRWDAEGEMHWWIRYTYVGKAEFDRCTVASFEWEDPLECYELCCFLLIQSGAAALEAPCGYIMKGQDKSDGKMEMGLI